MPNTTWATSERHQVGRAVPSSVRKHDAVDRMAHHASDRDHEGVHDTLDQRERHHVAVGDVAHLVREHRLDLLAAHRRSRPSLTATSARSRRAPVAKAFGSGEGKIATVGMPIPAARACWRTVSSSQASVGVLGASITRAPVSRIALHFEISSDTTLPPIPKTQGAAEQRAEVEPAACVQKLREPEQVRERAEGQHDREVGDDEECDAFHDGFLRWDGLAISAPGPG